MTKINNQQSIQKIRYCFSGVDESQFANCLPASAAAQHIEASIKGTNTQPDNGKG